MNCDDVEDSVPISSTSEAAPYELCDVEDSVPISSTTEAAPYELCVVVGYQFGSSPQPQFQLFGAGREE